jgi:hypothetical protein
VYFIATSAAEINKRELELSILILTVSTPWKATCFIKKLACCVDMGVRRAFQTCKKKENNKNVHPIAEDRGKCD